MKQNSMDDTYELLQVFFAPSLNANGGNPIIEVILTEHDNVVCSCKGFTTRATCEHSRLVSSRLKTNNGAYPYEFVVDPTDKDWKEKDKSLKAYNAFIRKYATQPIYSKNLKQE